MPSLVGWELDRKRCNGAIETIERLQIKGQPTKPQTQEETSQKRKVLREVRFFFQRESFFQIY